MKSSLFSRAVLIGLLAVGCQSVFAKTIKFKDLPAAVQRQAQSEVKNGPVKEVQSLEQNGRTIYQITFDRPRGADKVIYLDANGNYVQDQAGTTTANSVNTAAPASHEVPLAQVPEVVRNTINTETKNGPVARVEQLPHNGTQIYAVYFKQPNGQEKVIYLNSDGTYVQNSSGSAASTSATHSWDRLGTGAPPPRQPLSASTKVNLDQLPSAVRKTMQTEAGTAPIESVDRGTLNGQTVYEGAFKRNAQTVKLRVAENGSVLSDLQDYRIQASGPLLHAKKLSFKQLPTAVQNTIKAQAGQGLIETLQQGQINGQTVYEAALNQNGQLVQLRVDPAGSILSTTTPAQSSAVNPPQ